MCSESLSAESQFGYDVLAYSDKGEGYAFLQNEAVSVIVTEVTAYHDEDWNFVTATRAVPGYANLPIVACSAIDERRHGVALGVAAYLIKPVIPARLLTTSEEVINGQAANVFDDASTRFQSH